MPKQYIIFIFILLTFLGRSQTAVSSQLSSKLIADCGSEKRGVKPFLNLSSNKAKINPLTYVAGGLLFLYQNVLSEQISANCNFEISCSEYTKRSINEYGIFKGVLVGLHQLSCCSPTIYKDYCDYQLSENGKVKNEVVK